MDYDSVVKLLIALLLVLLNGFFVAAEFSIVKVRYSQIQIISQRELQISIRILTKHHSWSSTDPRPYKRKAGKRPPDDISRLLNPAPTSTLSPKFFRQGRRNLGDSVLGIHFCFSYSSPYEQSIRKRRGL